MNQERAVLLALFSADIAYVAWIVYFMDQVQGWESLLVAVFLMPPGILIGFALLAKLIAHLKGAPISHSKAFGFGGLGLFACFVALLIYNGLSH